jgi:putative transposase
VHQNGRIVSVATIVAVGVNNDGRREILGLDIGPSGAETFCTEFLRKLRRRGLRGVKLVVLDATKASRPRIEGADHQLATLPASTSCAMRSPTHGKSGRRVVSAFIVTALIGARAIPKPTAGGGNVARARDNRGLRQLGC